MPTIEAQDLINDAAKTLAIPQSNEGLSPDELNDGLRLLNFMLEEMSADGLEIFAIQNETHALTANQTTPYTIGDGATINVARPVKISAANVVLSDGRTKPLDLITAVQYARIGDKAQVSLRPKRLYYDNEFPEGSIYLWPWNAASATLDLWVWQQLADSFGLEDDIAFPPGYYLMLRYQLAKYLLALFPRQVDAGVQTVLDEGQRLRDKLTSLRASNVAGTEFPPGPPPPDKVGGQ